MDPAMERALERILAAIESLPRRGRPVLVALDGPSGSGKSTLAAKLGEAMRAVVVPSDDFFAAEVTAPEWAEMDPRERAERAIDWRRLRREALEPLLAGMPAAWRAFDFEAGARADGSYAKRSEPTRRESAPVIVLDGAYSTRPELTELISMSVLVDAPPEIRRARLERRESATFLRAWFERWSSAEAEYFAHVRPASSFDLVVSTAAHGGGS
jgi:para-aminobenzoate synthetase